MLSFAGRLFWIWRFPPLRARAVIRSDRGRDNRSPGRGGSAYRNRSAVDQMHANHLHECQQFIEIRPDDRFRDVQIQLLILMNGDVTKADHSLQAHAQRALDRCSARGSRSSVPRRRMSCTQRLVQILRDDLLPTWIEVRILAHAFGFPCEHVVFTTNQ